MWPDTEETRDLLEQVRLGDRRALDRLLASHRPALARLVRHRLDRMVSRRVDASDIVQEVLLVASRRLDAFLAAPTVPFAGWLRQLARDRLIDEHRRQRLAGRRSVEREQVLPSLSDQSAFELADCLRDPELTPAAGAIERELQERFRAAISDLDELDREMIQLRHIELLSNGETAERLGLSPAAAGMRHLRALRRLRDILGEKSRSDGFANRRLEAP